MKKFFITLMCLLIFNSASAKENNSDFETAQIRLTCALSALSSYSEEESISARDILISHGWEVDAITAKNNLANVKAYMFKKFFDDGRKIKILVITGTEEMKDVEVDFRVGKVPLHEGTEENIFVHRGFRDYADVALSDGLKEFLIEELKNNPEEILYITGHSLGGAVAMIGAIRLADAGADMNRIKVITFGAPAIGNRELANAYEKKIDLTRIDVSGDPVKKSLQILGYVHFGKSVIYNAVESPNHISHQMAIYLDTAIRNYYDLGGFENFIEVNPKNKIDTKIFVAPIKIVKKSFSPTEEKYIISLLADGLKVRLKNLTFCEPRIVEVNNVKNFSYDVTEFLKPARDAGCKYILVQLLNAKSVREAKLREMRVSLDEMIFDLEGSLISMQTAGPTTSNLTIIEAATFAQERLRSNREKIFLQ